MKTKEVTYTVIWYVDLQNFVKETYGLDTNIPYAEEWRNDTHHPVTVTGTLNTYDITHIDNIIKGRDTPEYSLCRLLLERLSIDGHIKPGEYLIKVEW